MSDSQKQYIVKYRTCCNLLTTVLWLDDHTAANTDGTLQRTIYLVEGEHVRSIVSVQPLL